eukprot:1146914-Pelagomonas_calceolata.AAC.25
MQRLPEVRQTSQDTAPQCLHGRAHLEATAQRTPCMGGACWSKRWTWPRDIKVQLCGNANASLHSNLPVEGVVEWQVHEPVVLEGLAQGAAQQPEVLQHLQDWP